MGHADRGGTENHYPIDSFLIPFLSKEIYSNTYGGTEIIFESFTIQHNKRSLFSYPTNRLVLTVQEFVL